MRSFKKNQASLSVSSTRTGYMHNFYLQIQNNNRRAKTPIMVSLCYEKMKEFWEKVSKFIGHDLSSLVSDSAQSAVIVNQRITRLKQNICIRKRQVLHSSKANITFSLNVSFLSSNLINLMRHATFSLDKTPMSGQLWKRLLLYSVKFSECLQREHQRNTIRPPLFFG